MTTINKAHPGNQPGIWRYSFIRWDIDPPNSKLHNHISKVFLEAYDHTTNNEVVRENTSQFSSAPPIPISNILPHIGDQDYSDKGKN